MRAARYHGREDLRIENVPERNPGPNEVKLRVLFNGLCGSDVHEFYHGPTFSSFEPNPRTGVHIPVILGHEFSGEVVGIGESVNNLTVGNRVAVEPIDTCGSCEHCKSGHYNHCRCSAFHGYSRDGGGLSEFTVVLATMCHRLPDNVSDEHGALVEPMAVAWHAVKRARVAPGMLVMVHGAGPIGIGALLAIRALGARAILSDPSILRRERALALGAEAALDPIEIDIVEHLKKLTEGRGVSASIDAAGVSGVTHAAIASTTIGGVVVIVAQHYQPIHLSALELHLSEVYLSGSAIYCDDYPDVIAAMAAGHYPLDGWVETIGLDDVIKGGLARLKNQTALKILVDPHR